MEGEDLFDNNMSQDRRQSGEDNLLEELNNLPQSFPDPLKNGIPSEMEDDQLGINLESDFNPLQNVVENQLDLGNEEYGFDNHTPENGIPKERER